MSVDPDTVMRELDAASYDSITAPAALRSTKLPVPRWMLSEKASVSEVPTSTPVASSACWNVCTTGGTVSPCVVKL